MASKKALSPLALSHCRQKEAEEEVETEVGRGETRRERGVRFCGDKWGRRKRGKEGAMEGEREKSD